jgi:hypothetical protein
VQTSALQDAAEEVEEGGEVWICSVNKFGLCSVNKFVLKRVACARNVAGSFTVADESAATNGVSVGLCVEEKGGASGGGGRREKLKWY